MTPREFIDQHGAEESARVAKLAGTNLVYFRQIANGFRKASPRLAQRLSAASDEAMALHEIRPDVYPVPR